YLYNRITREETEMHSDNKFKVEIFIEPDGDGFHAYCPALKGLHTCGDTEEEALENAKDATRAYLRSLIKQGDPIPVDIVSNGKAKVPHHTEEVLVHA
ncbi:type II toxin-antitoxin system HicB family antitoxin, partial [Dehalococcoidia bacterium]|nr:type II toxin-antitoxin system HicB family antitoxin [Dehalococcoidia bacterium]